MVTKRQQYEKQWRIINKYKYFCEDCIWHSPNHTEYIRHLTSPTHREKMDNAHLYVPYYCRPCNSPCVSEKEYLKHCKQKRHMYKYFVLLDFMLTPVMSKLVIQFL